MNAKTYATHRMDIETAGFTIVPEVLNADEVHHLRSALEARGVALLARRGGVRHLLDRVPEVRRLAESPTLRALVEPILGPAAIPVSAVSCTLERGGALLLRPLSLHASSPARSPDHRCVLHLEFAACRLPEGLQWHSRRGAS